MCTYSYMYMYVYVFKTRIKNVTRQIERSQEPYVHYKCWKEPYKHSKEPYKHSKEPYKHSKERLGKSHDLKKEDWRHAYTYMHIYIYIFRNWGSINKTISRMKETSYAAVMYIYICMYSYTCVYIPIHTYIYTYIYVYIGIEARQKKRSRKRRRCRTRWLVAGVARTRISCSASALGDRGTATHCNPLQHTATHCRTLQHTAAHCSTLQHTATHCTLQHAAAHCNTLQHTAAHCHTLQRRLTAGVSRTRICSSCPTTVDCCATAVVAHAVHIHTYIYIGVYTCVRTRKYIYVYVYIYMQSLHMLCCCNHKCATTLCWIDSRKTTAADSSSWHPQRYARSTVTRALSMTRQDQSSHETVTLGVSWSLTRALVTVTLGVSWSLTRALVTVTLGVSWSLTRALVTRQDVTRQSLTWALVTDSRRVVKFHTSSCDKTRQELLWDFARALVTVTLGVSWSLTRVLVTRQDKSSYETLSCDKELL